MNASSPAGRARRAQSAAPHLALRAELMRRIARAHAASGLTQVEAAAKLGVSQPRLNALLRQHVRLFSLDALVRIAARAGLEVRVTVRKA